MPSEAAARDAEIMREPDAARGALSWYRAMVFSNPWTLHAKITVPTLYLWSDGDSAVGEKGALLTPRFVAGPYTLLGPATPKHVADYLDAPVRDVKARWPSDAIEVSVDGGTRWVLAADAERLSAEQAKATRLLGPFDLFLQARDGSRHTGRCP